MTLQEEDHENTIQTLCRERKLNRAVEVLFHSIPSPSHHTYISLLRACTNLKSLSHTHHVHAYYHLYSCNNRALYLLIGSYLIVALAKCGALSDAFHISHGLPSFHRSVFSWTSIISACVDHGHGHEALRMYGFMLEDGFQPNGFTYASLFKACGMIGDLSQGMRLHADAHVEGILSYEDLFVCNSLLSMYGKCGGIKESEDVFHMLPRRNIVSWSAMLSVYVETENSASKALRLYRQMREEGVDPNAHTLVFALQACCALSLVYMDYNRMKTLVNANGEEEEEAPIIVFEIVQGMHSYALRKNYAFDAFVGTSLLGVYGKCGAIREAEHVFVGALIEHNHDVVVWNAMLSVYAEQGHGKEVLLLFREMIMRHEKEGGVCANDLSFVMALEACGILAEQEEMLSIKCRASADIGRAIHSDIRRTQYASDVTVMTALVSMYGKCGVLGEAENVFFSLLEPNIVTWTTMLSVYTTWGESENALWLYQHALRKEQVGMSDMTLTCILQACGISGNLDISQEVHFSLTSAGYESVPFVAPTLIHAYRSCARMSDAKTVFLSIPRPLLEAWNACIGVGEILESLRMFERLKLGGIDPDGVTFVAILSACSHAGLVSDGYHYFESIKTNHGITPDTKHYGSLVDLVCRAGNIGKAYSFLTHMPTEADLTIWLCLLGACCVHGNCIELATKAFEKVVSVQPEHGTAYILMSNAYVIE